MDAARQIVIDGLENEANVRRTPIDSTEDVEDAITDRQRVAAGEQVLHAALEATAAQDHRHCVTVAATEALDQMHHDLLMGEDDVRERRRLQLVVWIVAVAEVRTHPRRRLHCGATWCACSIRRRLCLLLVGCGTDMVVTLLVQDGRCWRHCRRRHLASVCHWIVTAGIRRTEIRKEIHATRWHCCPVHAADGHLNKNIDKFKQARHELVAIHLASGTLGRVASDRAQHAGEQPAEARARTHA